MDTLDWFRRICQEQRSEDAYRLVASHPALLWSAKWPEIEHWIAGCPTDEQGVFTARLKAIQNFAKRLEAQPFAWPVDVGPVDGAAQKVIAHEWTLTEGLEAASSADTVEALCPLYVEVVARRAFAKLLEDSWQDSVTSFKILLTALDVLPEGPSTKEMVRPAVLAWINCVAGACNVVPDGRLFSDALARGEAFAAAEEAAGNVQQASDARHRLGILHLDPYISGRSSQNYQNQYQLWLQRLADVYGKSVAADPSTTMPPPIEALTTAIGFFEEALPYRVGEQRGLTLKALAEAKLWLELLGGPSDRAKIKDCAYEALNLLPNSKYPRHSTLLRRFIEFAETDVATIKESTYNRKLSSLDVEQTINSEGRPLGIEQCLIYAEAVRSKNAELSIDVILRLWSFLDGAKREGARRQAVEILVRAFNVLYHSSSRLAENHGDLGQTRQTLTADADRGKWTSIQFSMALADLAFALSSVDREREGLQSMAEALEIAEAANHPIAAPLRVMRAILILNAGATAFHAKRFDEAVEKYVWSVTAFAAEEQIEAAVEALLRAEDIVFCEPGRSPTMLAVGLAGNATTLATSGNPRLDERLYGLWRRVIARTVAIQPINVELWTLEMQAAKGATFAAMLNRTERYDWRADPEAQTILARIDELGAAPERARTAEEAEEIDDPAIGELLLTAFAGDRWGEGADNPVANLQRRFDSHIARRMSQGVNVLEALLRVDELRKLIGPRTVLITQYLGHLETGIAALFTLIFTAESQWGAVGSLNLPWGQVIFGRGEARIETDWFGLQVAELRKWIMADPFLEVVTVEGAKTLADDAHNLLGGGIAQHLEDFRKSGKDHLCIHPHGSLHVYPQHLLGSKGALLADHWTVSYLPHPTILRQPLQIPTTAKDEMVAIGIGFENSQPHGLPPLRAAVEEAKFVASIFSGPCWTNSDATKARLIAALSGARRVHIATHSAAHSSAPSFQHLVLAPDGTSDGIFYAYEIAGFDLRHLDLVTLSACETSLGRFDVGDNNLRGLLASFFIAGVATIVSTLWPVADEVARLFFEVFYRSLYRKNSNLEAFRAAQIETREKYPAYRDWGAFQFSGRW
jgi:hypothetical protein